MYGCLFEWGSEKRVYTNVPNQTKKNDRDFGKVEKFSFESLLNIYPRPPPLTPCPF